jgi:uncharacterized protein (DUF1800 family)
MIDPRLDVLTDVSSFRYHAQMQRMTYGPRLDELARAAQDGLPAWIEEQLNPESIDDPAVTLRTRKFDRLNLHANALDGYDARELVGELKTDTLLRQIYSRRQLYEQMVDFWTDHFNISVHKNRHAWALKIVDDREVIRPYAMGNFHELLSASAHSPAMLVYLDNQANLKDQPNENYARELMELHTLGIDGGYTQQDVMELARCLTGWTVKKHFYKGEFTFNADQHDTGAKTVLGSEIQPGGMAEVESILEVLAHHPCTAQQIATKLVQRFICEDPLIHAPTLVQAAEDSFLQTGGEITEVLKVVLLDSLVNNPNLMRPKYKRPVNFITGTLRMLNAETKAGQEIWQLFTMMGQPTFEWPTPDGPPDESLPWANNLIPRWRFAYNLARSTFEDTSLDLAALTAKIKSPADLVDQISLRLLGKPYPGREKEIFLRTLSTELDEEQVARVVLAGVIASPLYQFV